MADLPDIDTSSVSFLAFFNAIDQGGVNDIDPTEVTNHSNVQSYTLYDNGVEGVYTTVTGRDCAFRVKEDGWFVAWLNRYENFNKGEVQNPDDVRGAWDLLNDWADHGSADDITQNSLERCINALKNELSNSGSITYSANDVGLYDYRHSSAAGVTALSAYGSQRLGNGSYALSPGLQYTVGTTVHWAAAASTVLAEYGSEGEEGRINISFNGTDINSVNSENFQEDRKYYGSIDLISRGLIPNANTEYTGTAEFYSEGDYSNIVEGTLSCLLVWE